MHPTDRRLPATLRTALAAALCTMLALPAVAAESPGARPASVGAVTVYRSVMPDGSIVLGDQPQQGARKTEAIGQAPGADPSSTARARQEREYWRQRAEAFARRQLQRELDDEHAQLVERERAVLQVAPVAVVPPVLYRPREPLNYTGQLPASDYTSSPGAAGRNLGTSADGSSSFAPGFGAPGVGAGMGGGVASGVVSGFIGSGFATSSR